MTDLSEHYWTGTLYTGPQLNAALADIAAAIDASSGALIDGLVTAPDRASMVAISASAGDSVLLTEGERIGAFVAHTGDYSTFTDADTEEGIYVAGDGVTWVRDFAGSAELSWWGSVADDNGTVGTDNFAAISAALATLIARGNPGANSAIATESLHIADGDYYCSETVELISTTRIWANGTGYQTEPNVKWRVPAGTSGFIIQRANTTGESGTGASHTPADGAAIVGLGIYGGYAGTESEHHGVMLRARGLVMDCYIAGFPGDGINVTANAPNGNANCWTAIRNSVVGCRFGLQTSGLDVNQGYCEQLDAMFNRCRPVKDNCIGNIYKACHSLSNGTTNPVGGVNFGTECYTPRPGYEEAARTNAPSGTTADTLYWLWVATYIQPYWAEWTNGMPVCVSTGGYYAANASNATVFENCYSEAEGPAVGEGHSRFEGGIYSSRKPIGAHYYTQEGGWVFYGNIGFPGVDGSAGWYLSNNNNSLMLNGASVFRLFPDGTLRLGVGVETGIGGDAAKVLGTRGAAVADATTAAAAPTQAEFNALVSTVNTLLARLRASTGHGLISG